MDRIAAGRAHSRDRTAGYDALRLLAILAVFYQHACTLLDCDEWVAVEGLRIGRLGTALFLGLSGYFAATTTRPPGKWLWERTRKLFPAYWIVLAISFAAAGVTGYKSFDAWQVVCQFAGIGLFTHQGQLVNVTTWFVCALFTLYVVAYLGMRTQGLAVLAALGIALAIGLERSSNFETVAVHAVTFLGAYSVGRLGFPCGLSFLVAGAVLAALSLSTPEFRYGAMALAGLSLSTLWRGEWRAGRLIATYAYEWYLVHGLCLHAVIRIVGDRHAFVFPLAAGLSIVAAVGLRTMIDVMARTLTPSELDPRDRMATEERDEAIPLRPSIAISQVRVR